MIKIYNTLTRKKEVFTPLSKKEVRIYTCGPTVYWFAHLGNLRTYIFEDGLKRILKYNGYQVKHVMNITDVGHLTSDANTGQDKMELGAKREKKTVWEIAKFYTRAFKKDLKLLNIIEPNLWIRATKTIKDQINLIKVLEKKGFAYKIADGVYFNSSKLKSYGRLWPKKMKLKAGARVEMALGKKNLTDFALWKLTPPGVKRQMEWSSPWGRGFPGWHTECVVMSIKHLGIPFDIHCGGTDHILIHHTNELAQAEAAYGKILANYWLHGEFLVKENERLGKSKGNIIILDDLIKKGFNPLSFRYLCLTAHYRSKLNFTWAGLKSSQKALENLYQKFRELRFERETKIKDSSKRKKEYQEKFLKFINDDLNFPRALGLLWKLVKDAKVSSKDKENLLLSFDKVLGLGLEKIKKIQIPQEIKKLVSRRERYRLQKKWQKADMIRKKIEKMGYWVEDTKKGPRIKKI